MVKTETKWHNSGRSGFTLLELLVVVGILAALVALALPFYQDYVNQSKVTAAEADLQTFKKALAMYDQLEPRMFGASVSDNLAMLIGKYLQDFRKNTVQTVPLDPWGNDYQLLLSEGVIKSWGPNGKDESGSGRIPLADDLLVTWKPPFYVTGAKAINKDTIEVSWSRKINDLNGVAGNTIIANTSVGFTASSAAIIRVSDMVYRFRTSAAMAAGNKTVVVNPVTAQDLKSSYDQNPKDLSLGDRFTFIY